MNIERLMRFVLQMRQAGVTDARALAALERTPRDHYAPVHLAQLAYDDNNLPLANGQTMTKPSVIGRMITALDVEPAHSVLEIGTGSGYQAAALSTLAARVTTIDRWRDLVADARGRLGLARIMHVNVHLGDGAIGWAQDAPYDRIIVNCAVAEIPPALIAQLAQGGALVAPVGLGDAQVLVRLRNDKRDDLGPIKFGPLELGAED